MHYHHLHTHLCAAGSHYPDLLLILNFPPSIAFVLNNIGWMFTHYSFLYEQFDLLRTPSHCLFSEQ